LVGQGGSWRLLIKGRPWGLGVRAERRGRRRGRDGLELESGSVRGRG
jgi:hypothetical protein